MELHYFADLCFYHLAQNAAIVSMRIQQPTSMLHLPPCNVNIPKNYTKCYTFYDRMTGIFNSIQLLYRKLEFFLSSVHEFPFGRTMFVHYSYTHSLASDTHSPQYIELDI